MTIGKSCNEKGKFFYTIRAGIEEDLEWDNFVERQPAGHYTQTSLWGKAKSTQGWNAKRLLLYNDCGLSAGAQLLVKKYPLLGSVGYISKGPLVCEQNIEIYESLVRWIILYCKQEKIFYLAVQPPDDGFDHIQVLEKFGFHPGTQGDIEKAATIEIDLTVDLALVLQQIKPRKRQNFRQAEKRGISYRLGDYDDLEVFVELFQENASRNSFQPESIDFIKEMWNSFYPHGNIYLFLAEFEGKPVSAHLDIAYKDKLYGYRAGWSGQEAKRHPNDGLIWYEIEWAKKSGYKVFDFGGIETEAALSVLNHQPLPKNLIGTYSEFKLHFSENVKIFPGTYEIIFSKMLDYLYHTMFMNKFIQGILIKIYSIIRKR